MAAGAVMGRTGQCIGLLDYIRENRENASKYGQALIAAAMNACVQCEDYELGLSLYYDLGNQPGSSEWQWAGGYGSVHPLCRDLALQCMGMVRKTFDNSSDDYSEIATEILKQIIEEDGYVSQKALVAVFRTYEASGEFDRALKLMHLIMSYRNGEMEWKIVGNSLENFMVDSVIQDDIEIEKDGIPDPALLNLVLATCNAAGEFGLSLLLCRMGLANKILNMNDQSFDDKESPINTLYESQPFLSTNDETLATTMFALCGLGRQCDAISLKEKVIKQQKYHQEGAWHYSNECLEYAMSLGKKQSKMWDETYSHMNRVIFAMQCMESTGDNVSIEEKELLPLAVTKMLRTSIESGHAMAGLYLAKSAASTFTKTMQTTSKSKSIKESVKSFFGLNDARSSTVKFSDMAILNKFLSSSDDILTTTMEAYKEVGQFDDAILLFFGKWEGDSIMRQSVRSASFHADPDNPDRKWINSCDMAIQVLLEQNRPEQAHSFFQAILPSYRSQKTYGFMANYYSKVEKWEEVARLYNDALASKQLSNEVALLAMQGVSQGKIDGKMRILRSIVDDIAPLHGMKAGAWIFQNYWAIKRQVGYHHARLLMWWNDPATTQEQELRIALQHLEESKKTRRKLDPDVLPCIITLAGNKLKKMLDSDSSVPDLVNVRNEAAEKIISSIFTCFDIDDDLDHTAIISKGIYELGKIEAHEIAIEFLLKLTEYEQGIYLSENLLKGAINIARNEGHDVALAKFESLL